MGIQPIQEDGGDDAADSTAIKGENMVFAHGNGSDSG
jgi:hypothetical protein